jgi:transcriptional regulator with XRE-family HTH domain
MASRPRTTTVWYRGIPYELDLVCCRRALVQRQVEGELDSMESLANAVGISRSTASRFFSGRATSLAVTLKILDKLGLKFENVARVVEETLRRTRTVEETPEARTAAQPVGEVDAA